MYLSADREGGRIGAQRRGQVADRVGRAGRAHDGALRGGDDDRWEVLHASTVDGAQRPAEDVASEWSVPMLVSPTLAELG